MKWAAAIGTPEAKPWPVRANALLGGEVRRAEVVAMRQRRVGERASCGRPCSTRGRVRGDSTVWRRIMSIHCGDRVREQEGSWTRWRPMLYRGGTRGFLAVTPTEARRTEVRTR